MAMLEGLMWIEGTTSNFARSVQYFYSFHVVGMCRSREFMATPPTVLLARRFSEAMGVQFETKPVKTPNFLAAQ